MFWFILGLIGSIGIITVLMTLFIIYTYGKSAEQAHKEGWDMPYW